MQFPKNLDQEVQGSSWSWGVQKPNYATVTNNGVLQLGGRLHSDTTRETYWLSTQHHQMLNSILVFVCAFTNENKINEIFKKNNNSLSLYVEYSARSLHTFPFMLK